MALHRFKLNDALNREKANGVDQTHLWCQEVGSSFKLDSVVVKGLGIFEVPFRRQKLPSIVKKYKTCNVKNAHVENQESNCGLVAAVNILAPLASSLKEKLSQFIDQALEREFRHGLEHLKTNIDIHLKSLVICRNFEPAGVEVSKEWTGTFGLLFMQLPVGPQCFVSARLKVHRHGRLQKDISYERKPAYYLTLLTETDNISSAKVTVQPGDRNPSVFLVFQLAWPNSCSLIRRPSSYFYPSFLVDLKKINQALIGWKNVNVDCQDLERPRNLRNTSYALPLDAKKTAVLCIPLKHSYHSFGLQFENLKVEDVRMANLLKLIGYVDVSLAILKLERVKQSESVQAERDTIVPLVDWKKEAVSTEAKTFSVHRWTQGDWMFSAVAHEKFSCLRFDRHLVGDITSALIEDEAIGNELGEEAPRKRAKLEVHTARSYSYHPAIIIRPLKAAILDFWKFFPVRAVQCLTHRLDLALDCNFNKEGLEQQHFIQAIDFINQLITKDDELSDCHRTAILHQLLHISTLLKASDKGLEILELIPQRRCECRKPHNSGLFAGFLEWNGKTSVEEAVATLATLVGWNRCSNLVNRMYSRREVDDYESLSLLNYWLHTDHGCIDAAIHFAKGSLSILAEHGKCEHFCSEDIVRFIDLTLSPQAKQEHVKEVYSLLEKAATTVHDVFFAMLEYYVDNREIGQLDDFKATISALIRQADRFADAVTASHAIFFAHQTHNSELAELVWSKLLNSGNDFERMLSDEETFVLLGEPETAYKAIARSPLASQRFYKFLEHQKMKCNYFLTCFYHLTMAENEPSLFDERKFHSYLSGFKEMNVESLVLAANVVKNFQSNVYVDTSPNITAALLDCVPTNDLASLLFQETDDFSNIMYCHLVLGNSASHLNLQWILEEALLDGNYEESGANGTITRLVMVWLTCLKQKIADGAFDRTVIAYQTLKCFQVYFDVTNVYGARAKSLARFNDVSQLLTVQFLEQLLISLYDREQRGSECLKVTSKGSNHWGLCQGLSDLLAVHREMKTAIRDFEAERIVRLMCCIFWLGSQDANQHFVRLVCNLPIATTRYCLSLFTLSSDELKTCANSSPFAFSALKSIVRQCFMQLFGDSPSSWSRRVEVESNKVEKFYQSEENSKSFGPFETMIDANNFADSAIQGLSWADYVVVKYGNAYWCEILKLYPVDYDDVIESVCCDVSLKDCLPKKSLIDASEMNKCTICLTRTAIRAGC